MNISKPQLILTGLGMASLAVILHQYKENQSSKNLQQKVVRIASSFRDKLHDAVFVPGDAGNCVPREKIANRRLDDSEYRWVIINDISDFEKACDPIKRCTGAGSDVSSCSGEDKHIVCVDPNSMGMVNLVDTDWTCSNTATWRFSAKMIALTTDGRRRASGDLNTTCYVSPLLCAESQK